MKMIGMSGPIDGDPLLQIQTVEVRQGHVEHQAARNQGAGAGQEFLRGRERLRLPACASISNSSDSRTEMSSSTTNTTGLVAAAADVRDRVPSIVVIVVMSVLLPLSPLLSGQHSERGLPRASRQRVICSFPDARYGSVTRTGYSSGDRPNSA